MKKTPKPQPNQSIGHPASDSGAATWYLLAVLMVAGLVAYWNSFHVPFIFDDMISIQNNTGVQFGGFLKPVLGGTRPLLYLTFALDFLVHGLDVWGYHLVNLLLHLCNGALLFFVAKDLIRRVPHYSSDASWYGFLAAGFFLLHPVQTESVTYISSRSELLSTLLFIAGLLLFIRRPKEKIGFAWSLVILVPFFLGLLSKETVITLPAILLLTDFIFFSAGKVSPVLRRWRFYMTFAIGGLVAIYYLITRVLAGSVGVGVKGNLSRAGYFLTELRVMVNYIRLIVLPVHLNLDYDVIPSSSFLEPYVLFSLCFLIALIVGAWLLRRQEPLISYSIFWFFITLLPTSSVVPISDLMVEHRLYLPLAGVCLAVPVFIERILQNRKGKAVLEPRLAAAGLLAILLIATVMRNQVWADEARLWTDVTAKSPEKGRGYSNLALAEFKMGEYQQAIATLDRGLANVNRPADRREFIEKQGNMYLQLGRTRDAITAFAKTTEVEDKVSAAFAFNNLGVAYVRLIQDLEQERPSLSDAEFQAKREAAISAAEDAFRKGMELDPSFFPPYDGYISVIFEHGKADEFYNRQELAIKQKPDARAFYALGKIAMLRGNFAAAVSYLQQATELDQRQKVAYLHLGYCLTQEQRLAEAEASYIRALRVDPLYTDARRNLALLYVGQKEFHKALESYQEILRFSPNSLDTHLEMAKILIELGDRRQAREHLSPVLRAAPQNEVALQLWRMAGS